MMGEIEKKKKGRPSKADLARRAAAEDGEFRRRLRCRNEEEDWEDEPIRKREKVRRRVVVHSPPVESDEDDDDVDGDEESSADASVRDRKAGSNDADSVPGTPSDFPVGVSLPDKKTLEMVLDKLQKKDTYGVYAEAVDPDELPDYHDVIEHPMDFATMRKKLGKGSYSTLEQFESDILLICSNAMLYNAPDTIYHKQAFSIQELAKRKCQRLRSGAEQYEKVIDSEPKPSNSFGTKKQIRKKPTAQNVPETVASDLSSGTVGDLQPGSTTKASASDRPNNIDESVDGTATQSDNNLDKVEELPSGKGHISRLGKKRLVHAGNRRATYNISTQPVSQPESMFSTFDGEAKQLVTVGLNADHSYARSLARFAAMLGPVAWNVASKKIEQALPPDFKYGRGWVGDYEPISRPVLVVQKCSEKETILSKPVLRACANPNNEKNFKTAKKIHKNPIVTPNAEGNSILSPISYSHPSESQPFSGEMLDVKPKIAANINFQGQNPRAKNVRPEKKVKKKQVQLNSPPSPGVQSPREFSSANQIPNNTSIPGSNSKELHTPDMNRPISLPFKPPQNNGFVEMNNDKLLINNFGIPRTTISVNTDREHMNMPANYFPHGHNQALTDPVQLMRRFSENTPNQHKNQDHLTTDNPLVSSSRKEDSSNASSAAARAWMSIGAGSPKSVPENTNFSNRNQIFVNSLHSPTQVSRFRGDFPVTGMQLHPMNNNNNFPIQSFMSPQFQTGNETHFQNRPQMVFPQLVATDLSRFQCQYSPNQGQHLLQRQPSLKHETTIPPDLNLMFQSSGSPGKSSGFQVDSQQPDLALQL